MAARRRPFHADQFVVRPATPLTRQPMSSHRAIETTAAGKSLTGVRRPQPSLPAFSEGQRVIIRRLYDVGS
jgi:hypothetical protein